MPIGVNRLADFGRCAAMKSALFTFPAMSLGVVGEQTVDYRGRDAPATRP